MHGLWAGHRLVVITSSTTAARIARSSRIVDHITRDRDPVTSETVPAIAAPTRRRASRRALAQGHRF
jgi:hypothetical protein